MRIRPITTLAVALLLILPLMATARADVWHQSFSITGQPSLQVQTDDGDVDVQSWDRPVISAQVLTGGWSIGPGGVSVDASQMGNSVQLAVREPHFGFNWGNHWVRVEITVPRALSLQIHTSDGDVTVADVQGMARLHTSDGNIRVTGLDATELDATSGDGNIVLAGRFQGLDVRSGDGNLRVQAEPGSQIATPWSLRSGDGDLELALPNDFKADLEAHTSDGDIHLDFPVSITGQLNHSEIRGSINGGGGLLTLRTGDGSIHLSRR